MKYTFIDTEKSENFKTRLKDLKIAVIGDLMLDTYIYGSVSRISPEAPVPVVKFTSEESVPGGAGNVAANLSGLGVHVYMSGRIGDDEYGRSLLAMPQISAADASCAVRSGRTIVKTRVIGGGRQQMLRIDREDIISPDAAQISFVCENIGHAIDGGLNCVVISDYGKGFCSPELCGSVIKLCRDRKVRVFVDPKCSDWTRYEGAFLITPNIKELSMAAGENVPNEDAAVVTCAEKLLAKYAIDNILVTRSEKGATLVTRSGFAHCHADPVEVYDVSGAGDTMIATVSAFSASGVPLDECVRIANTASQIVIGKVGTYPISAGELSKSLCRDKRLGSDKVVDSKKACETCAAWKKEGLRVVFTNGCFDILHAGHIDSLKRARKLGDRLIIGLNSDASVRRLKGPSRPVNGQFARAAVLAALESVDLVVIFDEDTPSELLSCLRPNIIAKGGDYRPEDVAGREYADEVVILPLVEGYSTTKIIEKISDE